MEQNTPEIVKTNYVFHNFFTGPNNRLAFSAALKVSEEPGRIYNPLVIYGGVGLGKTHLLHAVGNAVALSHPEYKIEMLAGSQLVVGDLARAEQADLLLFDDLHLGLHQRDVQVRLLPLFDRMIGSGRQIVITTDTHPQKIEALDPKLLSRLLGGVFAALKEIELREKGLILFKKAEARGQKLPEDVLQLIASRVSSNVRELEGALNRVLLYSSLMEGPVTKETVDEALPQSVAAEIHLEPAAEAIPDEPAAQPEGEFGAFVSGLDDRMLNMLTEQQDTEKIRREYKEKIYIWKMKGFNTASVELSLDQDISILASEYDKYTANVEKLIDLQQQFGQMAGQSTPEEMSRIESVLFDPEQTDKLEQLVKSLVQRLSGGKIETTGQTETIRETPVPEIPRPEAPPMPVMLPEPEDQPVTAPEVHPEPQNVKSPETPVQSKSDDILAEKTGNIEENWPWVEDRLMEEF
ncbi:MAG: DnaA/Hda family protein [bacterium]|nr:DnaA/Hda family protein [bacterium]